MIRFKKIIISYTHIIHLFLSMLIYPHNFKILYFVFPFLFQDKILTRTLLLRNFRTHLKCIKFKCLLSANNSLDGGNFSTCFFNKKFLFGNPHSPLSQSLTFFSFLGCTSFVGHRMCPQTSALHLVLLSLVGFCGL